MHEVCVKLNMEQFELVMGAVVTHIKAIASSYGFDSSNDKIDITDALICEDDESVPEGLTCGVSLMRLLICYIFRPDLC